MRIVSIAGADLSVVLTVYGEDGVEIDLTGKNVRVFIGQKDEPPVITLTNVSGVSVLDQTLFPGKILWEMTGAQSAQLGPGKHYYEVWDVGENKPIHLSRVLELEDGVGPT